MKLGVHESYQGPSAVTLESTIAGFPLNEVTREFEANPITPQDLVSRLVARCGPALAMGQTVVWSFKPTPADVRNGTWQEYVAAVAQYIHDNQLQGRVIICIWHEPENDAPKYFKNAADFVSMFDTVHGWIKAVDPDILTTHAALAYRYRNMTPDQAAQWVTKADIHSIDIYSGRSFPLGMTLGTSKAFRVWRASRPAGAAWGVSERGWIAAPADSTRRAASIDAEADYLVSLAPADRPAFYIVWNTDGTEHDPKLVLDTAGVLAVNRMFDRLTRVVCPRCGGSGYIRDV